METHISLISLQICIQLDTEEREKNDSILIFYIFTLQNDKGLKVR